MGLMRHIRKMRINVRKSKVMICSTSLGQESVRVNLDKEDLEEN